MLETLQSVALGKSGLTVSALGIGTWQWGDARFWQYGKDYGRADVDEAYRASRAAGVTFFDTAEIYGRGISETILGALVRTDDTSVVVATKFAPLPGRVSARTLARALDASLTRLGMNRVDLYQVHWPYTVISIDALMHALADQVEAGSIRAVGVSNFSASQMQRAHAVLAGRGIPLASNQVHYSLLHRNPERNGVLTACRDLDVRLIAYSPLEQGVLTGKYHGGVRVAGARRLMTRALRYSALQRSAPLIDRLRQVGAAHGGKSPAQVALNWLMRQGTVPIPGAKNATQAAANAGAMGWQITDDELEQLSAIW